MTLFLVPRDEHLNFVLEEIHATLRATSGVSNIRSVDRASVDLEWTYRPTASSESVNGRLQREGTAVVLDPDGVTASAFALLLSRRVSFPVDLFNEEYTFHLQLDQYKTAEDLWTAIQAAYAAGPTDGPEPYRG